MKSLPLIFPKINLALVGSLLHSGAVLKTVQLTLAGHSMHGPAGFTMIRVNVDAQELKKLLRVGPCQWF